MVLDGLLLFSSDELCEYQMRRDIRIGEGRKRNRDYVPIRIVIRAISPTPYTQRGRSGRRGETIYASGRRLFIRFRSKVIAGFRVACSRASRGWVNSSDSVVCTEHSRGIDNSHDRRDESAGITLRNEFASVNLARISQTHDTHIEPAMRPTNCTLATHGNFLLLPPLSCNYYIGVKSIYTSRI